MPRLKRYQEATVRISSKDDRTVGFGMLVGPSQVVTCAHVVNVALGRDPNTPDQPVDAGDMKLDFPLLHMETRHHRPYRTARVVAWKEPGNPEDGGDDVAGLELNERAPDGAVPAKFRASPPKTDTWLKVFGVPAGDPTRTDGAHADVQYKGPVNGWRRLQVDGRHHQTTQLQPGYSGSAAWHKEKKAVGLVALAPEAGAQAHDGRLLPPWVIAEVWPEPFRYPSRGLFSVLPRNWAPRRRRRVVVRITVTVTVIVACIALAIFLSNLFSNPSGRASSSSSPGSSATPAVNPPASSSASSPHSQTPPPPFECASGSITLVGSSAFGPFVRQAAHAYINQYCQHYKITITVNPPKPGDETYKGDSAYGLSYAKNPQNGEDPSTVIAMYDGLPDASISNPLRPYPPVGVVIFSVIANNDTFPEPDATTGQLVNIFVGPDDGNYIAIGRRGGSAGRLNFFREVLRQDPAKTPSAKPCNGQGEQLASCTTDNSQDAINIVNSTPRSVSFAAVNGTTLQGDPNVSVISIDGDSPTTPNVLNKKYHFVAVEHLFTATSPKPLATDFINFLRHYMAITAQDGLNPVRPRDELPGIRLPLICRTPTPAATPSTGPWARPWCPRWRQQPRPARRQS
jgi:ABC-type phosphate transport system substrate-binding protein